MKNLARLSAALLSLGMLGASACSSCSQTPASDPTTTDPAFAPQSYNCGPGTHLVGRQCVGDTPPPAP